MITGLRPADQALKGFGGDIVITMLGFLILAAVLTRTGVLDIVGGVVSP